MYYSYTDPATEGQPLVQPTTTNLGQMNPPPPPSPYAYPYATPSPSFMQAQAPPPQQQQLYHHATVINPSAFAVYGAPGLSQTTTNSPYTLHQSHHPSMQPLMPAHQLQPLQQQQHQQHNNFVTTVPHDAVFPSFYVSPQHHTQAPPPPHQPSHHPLYLPSSSSTPSTTTPHDATIQLMQHSLHSTLAQPAFTMTTSAVPSAAPGGVWTPMVTSVGASTLAGPSLMVTHHATAPLAPTSDTASSMMVQQFVVAPVARADPAVLPTELRFSSNKKKRATPLQLVIPPPAPGRSEALQIVVHYLSADVTDPGLKHLFSQYDGCTHARVVTESGTGRSRGFGYVWFTSQAAAMNAIEETNGRVLLRKRIRVVFAAPQSPPW